MTTAVIPIKLHNERAPGKNLRPLPDGTTLLDRILRTVTSIDSVDETFVFCSDPSIRGVVESAGGHFLRRDPSLDLPTATSNDILRAFASVVPSEVYVLAHATSPFLTRETLQRGIAAVTDGPYDSSLSVRRSQEFMWSDGVPANYDPASIPRTQDLPATFIETSGYYAFVASVLLVHGRRVGFHPFLVPVSKLEAIDVDEEEDFAIAAALIQSGVVA